MKFILISVGIFSIFHTVLSLKCYNCNHPQFDFNDKQCAHPTQVECQSGEVCGKAFTNSHGEIFVAKGCNPENTCRGDEFTVNVKGIDITASCCKSDLCNGSTIILQNKFLFYTLMLFSTLKLFF